jgi:hypothetical protein
MMRARRCRWASQRVLSLDSVSVKRVPMQSPQQHIESKLSMGVFVGCLRQMRSMQCKIKGYPSNSHKPCNIEMINSSKEKNNIMTKQIGFYNKNDNQ